MYYKLTPSYILRGWDKVTCVLVHRPENRAYYLTNEDFQTLVLCDGNTDFTALMQNPKIKTIIEKALARHTIVECEQGDCITEDQMYRYYNNRYVQKIVWSITGKCNYRCRHCYMDAPDGLFGQMSHEQALGLIDDMAECGILKVDLTGGEPLVRQDFWELVDHLVEKNIWISEIYTNGWLVNEKLLDEFERRGLKPEFSISFDGIGWHDWMRRFKGAEKKAIEAIQLLISRGYIVTIEMCVHRGNAATLRDTINLLASLGVHTLKTGYVEPTELWKANSDGNESTKEEYIRTILDYLPYFYEDGAPLDVMFSAVASVYRHSTYTRFLFKRFSGEHDCSNALLCGSARFNCYIGPDGRLLPCMPMTASSLQSQFPMLTDHSLHDILQDSFYLQSINSRVKDLFEHNLSCGSCQYRYYCGGGCRAITVNNHQNYLDGTDEMQCFIWKSDYHRIIEEMVNEATEHFHLEQS